MIQWMHALSKSWIAVFLMGGLALSFVVWGIADVFTGGATTAVASVGGTDITPTEFQRSYRNYLRNQGRESGSEITPEMAEKMGLPRMVLESLINRAALNNEAQRLKLITSDAALVQAVRSMAPFRGTLGQFDRMAFMQTIGNAGYTEAQFLNELRNDMTRAQLLQAVAANFTVPVTYAQAFFQHTNERRAVEYVILAPEQAGDIPAPSDTVLAAYLKSHSGRYSTPEYRDAQYAAIAPDDVMGSVAVTDEQIQRNYDAAKSTYIIAEKRDVQQIEFKTEAEARAAHAKIAAGARFEDIAAERGLKPEQISLGTLAQEDLPDADRAKAIFALPLNQVSQPIKTGFGGFVLARVTKIAPGSSKALADVKEEIRKDLTDKLVANKLVDAVNLFTDARSSGDELAEAAKKAGMKLVRVTAVDATGLTPDGGKADVPADPDFLPALFRGEVGEDVEPFPTKLGAYYAIHVNGTTPPKAKTLEQVRAQVLADWTGEQRAKALAAKAQSLAAQAVKEKSLDSVARQLNVSIQHSPALSRTVNDTMFNAAMAEKLFSAGPGGVAFGPQGLSGNYVIARITGISHPMYSPQDPNFQGGIARFSQSVAQDFTIALAGAARERQKVRVNQQAVASLTGSGQ